MQIPKPTHDDKAAFHALVPNRPDVVAQADQDVDGVRHALVEYVAAMPPKLPKAATRK